MSVTVNIILILFVVGCSFYFLHKRYVTAFFITVAAAGIMGLVTLDMLHTDIQDSFCSSLHGNAGTVTVTGEYRDGECVLVGRNGLVYASEPVSVFSELTQEQRDQQVKVLLAGK